MKLSEKVGIVDKLLIILKENKLTEGQKKKLLTIVENIPTATDLQKERFILTFGLDTTKKKYTLKEICEICNCRQSSIRNSIIGLRCKLIRKTSIKDIEIFKNIVESNNDL